METISGISELQPIKSGQDFSPPAWAHQTNIYEVNLRQYTVEGTINQFATHLPRLKNMGVKTLWFMPITPISVKKRKGSLGSYYACSDYLTVSPEFGTFDDFRKLVRQAHSMGMKVIIDWVANHTGWDHQWTRIHPEWYKTDPDTGDFKMASGMEDIIELDFSNMHMRESMIDAMKFWVAESQIDGFRCDLAYWVQLDFWMEARTELEKIKPLFWLGELDPIKKPEYMGVFDAAYTWSWMHRTRDFYHDGLALDDLMRVLESYDNLGNETMRTWFTTNHDENSWNGTEFEKYGEMAEALAVFSLTWNGIPLLYSGQELPNRKRLAFFDKDPIPWAEELKLEEFYKTLLSLQTTNPALRAGDDSATTRRIHVQGDHRIFCYLRESEDQQVLVILNLSGQSIGNLRVSNDRLSGTYQSLFSAEKPEYLAGDPLDISPWGYHVYTK